MLDIRRGDSYRVIITLRENGVPLDIDSVESVEFMFCDRVRKVYPSEEAIYDAGVFSVLLTESDTFTLEPNGYPLEYQARVQFTDGEVRGTPKYRGAILEAISNRILGKEAL